MKKETLVEMIKKVIKEELEFDSENFRDLGINQQANELTREFNKKFKTIHFADDNKIGSIQQFIFMDENDSIDTLNSALKFIKSTTHMSGRVGVYEGLPAIILHY